MTDDEILAQLALAAPSVAPPPHLRDRLLARLPRQHYDVVRAGDGSWIPFAAPGVYRRTLTPTSFLLRLDPGAVLPAHPHSHDEHCLVLEGDLFDDEHSLGAGDFEIRYAGSSHTAVSSRSGAVVYISGE